MRKPRHEKTPAEGSGPTIVATNSRCIRSAPVTGFFLAYVYSNTDNLQANLHYLDYQRLNAEDEKRE